MRSEQRKHRSNLSAGHEKSEPNDSGFSVALDAGGELVRRTTRFLPDDGTYLFEDVLQFKGTITARVITCSAWLLELYELVAGELFFISSGIHIRPATKVFGVLYPPFTISQPGFKNAKGHVVGVAGPHDLPAELTTMPVVFDTTFTGVPSGAKQAIEIIESGTNLQVIAMNPRPSLLSLKAKRLIDDNYLAFPSMARVAERLGVTPEHLSRQFKRDFEMSPTNYLHQLRLADAPLRLAKGEDIVNVSQDVGYNDLSRFYKQFRKATKTSPGVCRSVLKSKRA